MRFCVLLLFLLVVSACVAQSEVSGESTSSQLFSSDPYCYGDYCVPCNHDKVWLGETRPSELAGGTATLYYSPECDAFWASWYPAYPYPNPYTSWVYLHLEVGDELIAAVDRQNRIVNTQAIDNTLDAKSILASQITMGGGNLRSISRLRFT